MPATMADIMNPGAAPHDPSFPHAPSDWTPESAEAAAQRDGFSLDQDHWDVIRALQALFVGSDRPNVRMLHDALDERFHAKGGLKHLYEILPGGPVAQGCRLAGLQAPAGAADRSFGSVQ